MKNFLAFVLTPRFYVPFLALVTDALLVFGVTLDPTIKTSIIGVVTTVGGWVALGLPIPVKGSTPTDPPKPS